MTRKDAALLTSRAWRQKAAQGIADGIVELPATGSDTVRYPADGRIGQTIDSPLRWGATPELRAVHTAAHGGSDDRPDETTDEGLYVNIRSLTRGDGVVIGAAVLLFIASFLDTFDCSGGNCDDVPNAWDNGSACC